MRTHKSGNADGINLNASPDFQRGPLKDLSRCLKSGNCDAGVVLYDDPLSTVIKDNYIIEPVIGAIRGRNPDNPSDRTAGIQTTQRLEIGGTVSNTLTTVQKDNVVLEPNVRVRKLTPKECWRLMGFDDESFERAAKVNSNSQLYKQAGNSIVVNVLEAIFNEMIDNEW